MPPTSSELKYVNSLVVYGHSVVTSNNAEVNPNTSKLPTLWQQFYANRYEQETPVFCVYWDYELDKLGLYKATVGTASNEIKGLDVVIIQEGSYLVFENRGPKPAAIIEIWQYIWRYFENTSNSDYQRTFKTDFEHYTAEDTVTVYIGIKKPV